ncbi:MAG TPA: hypothetical protein VMU34_24175 [Mycobacterium sp.]|nr:hypothetical protein [Mycobacterium sp.]
MAAAAARQEDATTEPTAAPEGRINPVNSLLFVAVSARFATLRHLLTTAAPATFPRPAFNGQSLRGAALVPRR